MATMKEMIATAFEERLEFDAGLEPGEWSSQFPGYKQFLLQRFYPFHPEKAQWACRLTTEGGLAGIGFRLLPPDIADLESRVNLDVKVEAHIEMMTSMAQRAVPVVLHNAGASLTADAGQLPENITVERLVEGGLHTAAKRTKKVTGLPLLEVTGDQVRTMIDNNQLDADSPLGVRQQTAERVLRGLQHRR